MKIVTTLDELHAGRARLENPLGFVPTMGFLHQGHLSLVRAAREICSSVAVSIFVNPTQFAPSEDLSRYPRDLERDLALLKRESVDLVWTPNEADLYPEGFQTWVSVAEITKPLEGANRPSHFRGVTTVVAKLFNAVRPQIAFFGQKDAQQAVVIKRMVEDLNFPIEIKVCPIVREADGLAMSSRNAYLDPDERKAAPVLFRALKAAEQMFQNGHCDADALRDILQETLCAEPLANPQYVSVADPETLEELHGSVDHALLSMAVFIGKTRLIDNLVIGDKDPALCGEDPDPNL
jgi:pantoate--beta-alanine ligase